MDLPQVALGDPHVNAHNAERNKLNALTNLTDPAYLSALQIKIAEIIAEDDTVIAAAVAAAADVPDSIAAAVSGYEFHSNVDGLTVIDSGTGTHVFNIVDDSLISFEDAPNGTFVSLYFTAGAELVTVDGISGLELENNVFVTFGRIEGVWVVAASSGGGSTGIPDETPPTAVSSVTPGVSTATTISFSWTLATDAESTVKYKWRVTPDGGSASALTTTSATTATAIFLLPNTEYMIEVFAFSAGGASAIASAIATTDVEPLNITDTFTAADGTNVAGRTPTGGSTSWAVTELGYMTGSTTPVITGNKIVGPGSGKRAVSIPIPPEGGTAEFDYTSPSGGSFRLLMGEGTSVWFTDVDSGGNVYLFRPGPALDISGSGQPTSGRVQLRVAPGEKTTVKINGVTVLTSTENHNASWSAPVVQIGLEGPATIDNFSVIA